MSEAANVETVRAIYERWGRGDFTAGPELYDEETQLVLRPEFPDAGTHRGRQGIANYMRGLLAAWDRFSIEATEVHGYGDRVLVRLIQRGVGSASGVETELPYFMVWTFDGPRVARIESIKTEAEARQAAVGEEDAA
jgi:ketosteroid isomerase-like protein